MKALALIAFLAALPAFAQEGVFESQVSVSGSNARTAADLSTGWKTVYCTVAAFYRMGTSAATATTSDEPIPANTHWLVLITNEARRLAFITSGGTGTCSIYPRNTVANRLFLPPLPALLPNVNGIAITPSSVTASGVISASEFDVVDVNGIHTGSIIPLLGQGIEMDANGDGNVNIHAGSAGTVNIDGAGVYLGAGSAAVVVLGNAGNSTDIEGNISFGSPLPALSSTGNITTTSTLGNQFACTGAGTCNLQSATSQTMAVDCGGGTCIASLGTGGATTTTVGRSGATTNINGTVTAGTIINTPDLHITATTTAGSITLSTGTGTATVRSGSKCVCTDSTANASVKCAVTTTTLTATGTGSDVINYFCF